MRARLGSRHADVTAALDAHGVGYITAEAGFFLLCDLRPWHDEPGWDAERRLSERIVDEANVNLTPGSVCRICEPGWFRLCYASEARAGVLAAIEREGRLLGG